MTLLLRLVLVVHFAGLAALGGGTAAQAAEKEPRITATMLHGALTQLVSGLTLWWIADGGLHQQIPTAKMIVKIGLLVLILGPLWSERAKPAVGKGLIGAVGALCLAEVCVAVLWT
jgi:hypothetical protein